MKIPFSVIHKMKLLFYASEENHSGHWGNSEIEIPEYAILLKKIKEEKSNFLNLTGNEVKIILDWFETATNEGFSIDSDDASLIKNIRDAIYDHLVESLEYYEYQVKLLLPKLENIDSLLAGSIFASTEKFVKKEPEQSFIKKQDNSINKENIINNNDFEIKAESAKKLIELSKPINNNEEVNKNAKEFIKKMELMSKRLKL